MSEQIKTGQIYRILSDKARGVWDKLSFWTKASDVEFDDGVTLQNKFWIGKESQLPVNRDPNVFYYVEKE